MKTAKEMFEEMGFRKNESICYNNQHILYEKPVMDGTDILTVEFKDMYCVYSSSLFRPMKTYKDVHLAIHKQMIELGWLDE